MGNSDSNMPLVTVQLSCYNHENYVRHAMESVLNGTYQNFELFITDDGSTDKTRDVIREIYEEHGRDERIHLF